MCCLRCMCNLDGGVTHLSVQTLLLRLQLTEGALELFQLTLKTRNFPLSQELLLLLHTKSITLTKSKGNRPPVMVSPRSRIILRGRFWYLWILGENKIQT